MDFQWEGGYQPLPSDFDDLSYSPPPATGVVTYHTFLEEWLQRLGNDYLDSLPGESMRFILKTSFERRWL